MNILEQAIMDAERFIKEAKIANYEINDDTVWSARKSIGLKRGSVKHSSMLLSRSLSTLRQTPVCSWLEETGDK